MAKKHRAQILLEEEQYQILSEIAELEGRSISDVARRVLDAGFDVLRNDLEAARRSVHLIRETGPVYRVEKKD